jgi:hypothetical protein
VMPAEGHEAAGSRTVTGQAFLTRTTVVGPGSAEGLAV